MPRGEYFICLRTLIYYMGVNIRSLGNLTEVDMKVYPTHECGSECPFCMTDLRWKNSELETEEYLKNFKKAFTAYYEEGGRKVLFTGGEPTRRHDKLVGMLRVVRNAPLDLVVLYTNGLTLLDNYQGKRLIDTLHSEGMRDINISLHHYNPKRREELSQQGVCDIETIAQTAEELGMKIRLNCTLLKDYIGTHEEVTHYLKFAQDIGINDVYFRDLFHLENRKRSCAFANRTKLAYTDSQRIDFHRLIQDIISTEGFEETQRLQRHRDHGSTFIFKCQNMRVSFGTLEIGTEKENEVTYFNFQPDGCAYRDMNGPESKIEL